MMSRTKSSSPVVKPPVAGGNPFKAVPPRVRLAWLGMGALATAWLVYLSFPRASQAAVAWVALVPFLCGVTRLRRFWTSFFYSWVTAFLFHLPLFYWIYYTCLHGGGMGVGLSLAAWGGLCALLSLQFACVGGSCYFFKKTGPFFPLLVACAFVALEWLHQQLAFYGLGFPWLMWGYSQWNVPAILQLAAYTGVYGISFVIVFINALISWSLNKGVCKTAAFGILAAAGLFLGLFAWGSRQIPPGEIGGERKFEPLLSVDAVLMQPNIDQYKKWNPAFEQEITETLTALGSAPENQGAMLVVWPESALPGELAEEKYARLMADITQKTGAYQVVGSALSQDGKAYVGAYLISPDGSLQVYKKVKLVPFGEYMPMEKLIRALLPHVEILGALGAFVPGENAQPLLSAGGVVLGSTICYEAIFPQLWRRQNRQGAKLFVNITNDAWFFHTAAPYQHLAANVLRAAETHRSVLRAANTGFSAVIDPFGRILHQTQLFTPGSLRAQVPLPLRDKTSFYTRCGDWFAWLCFLVFITSLIPLMVFAYD